MAIARTHYDQLKVARDAPPEVIRAAYRVLAQKYHPDRNPGDVEFARAMAVVNEAYRVLSDPRLRLEHDQWIDSLEEAQPLKQPTRAGGTSKPYMKDAPRSDKPENSHTQHVPGSRSVDLNTVWDGFAALFGLSGKK